MDITEETASAAPEESVKIQAGGYPWDFFTPAISPFYSDQYSCSICYLVLRDPYKCQNSHLFCKSCIYNWIVSDNRCSLTCPVCRDNGPFEVDSRVKYELDNHSVCCLSTLCCWIGKLSEYYGHAHGKDLIQERQVPDLVKTFNQERIRKARGDGFINEDRIVTMMSVIYADIEHRRRRIENIRMGRNVYTQDQLGDIQLLHDRLLSLRQNIDTFFGQTDSSPLWTRISHISSRPVDNSFSSLSSDVPSEPELSDEPRTVDPMSGNLSEISFDEAREDTLFFGDTSPIPSLSSEFDFSDDNSNQADDTPTTLQLQELVDDMQFAPLSPLDYDVYTPAVLEVPLPEREVQPTVQTNLPSSDTPNLAFEPADPEFHSLSGSFLMSFENSPSSVETFPLPASSSMNRILPRTSSTATSRLRYDYLSRRFNLRPGRRESDPTDIKRRKMQ